ncbi:MAG: tRNA uridine-5-carboxymethylaminomethyl(34) synthesis GTPase MnmE [Muribaculaceae bacterium]|nr:tRNA uridine-5-carboxymethylaminomethyl(34) synthesis GTPase MnmE [Muribaculaceae bacterium]
MTTNDTICAISTPHGTGGIAVVRVSGPDAIHIVNKIWQAPKPLTDARSHTTHLGNIIDPSDLPTNPPLDQALATVFRAPTSFTGENVVEISVHGSIYIQQQLLNILISQGCRLAEPGEFTRRAFVAGNLDLAQAEAIADVIAAKSRAAHRIAANQMRGKYSSQLGSLREQLLETASLLELELDFSEEDVEFASRQHIRQLAGGIKNEINRLLGSFTAGNAIKDGIPVAIIGPTNAGKSSLLNAIVGDDRAIVSNIHGTTRDTIEETININDFSFRFIDTAGLRQTSDVIEQHGIDRSRRAISAARIVIAVADVTTATTATIDNLIDTTRQAASTPPYLILLLNKTDIASPPAALLNHVNKCAKTATDFPAIYTIQASSKTGDGIERHDNRISLNNILTDIANAEYATGNDGILVTNTRHIQALTAASTSVDRVIDSLDANLTGDLIAQDIRETINHLAAITGDIPSTQILATIFSRFCIGK